MKKIFKTIYYIGGTVYRGFIGFLHNIFDKEQDIPDGVAKEVIGTTLEGRHIDAYKTGQGEKILIVGGIHGNEVGTVKLAKKIINHFFVNKPGSELYVIPVLNVDGYAKAKKNPDYTHRGKLGRFNSRDVDLNRNFPSSDWQSHSSWGKGKSYEVTEEVYAGAHPASEPETKALVEFIEKHNIKNLIMLHNVGLDTVVTEGNEKAKKWADIYKKHTRFDTKYLTIKITGSAQDWANEQNIHYMTVEGSTRWGSDWKKQKEAITRVIQSIK